jgi:hypothetical protein
VEQADSQLHVVGLAATTLGMMSPASASASETTAAARSLRNPKLCSQVGLHAAAALVGQP